MIEFFSSLPRCSKEKLYSLLNYIFNLLHSSKYQELNDSNRTKHQLLERRFESVYKRWGNLPDKITLSDENLLPNDIKKDWEQFDNSFDGTITESVKMSYDALIKKTASFLKYIESFLANNPYSSFNIRSIDLEEKKKKQTKLKKQYDKLKESIDNEQNANKPDTQSIKFLQEKLDSVVQEMKEVQEKVESVNNARKTETQSAERIENAFNDLSVYTHPIKKEKEKTTVEYWCFL